MPSRHPKEYARLLIRLREARLEPGLSQEDVAALLGARQTFVSKFELGDRRIDPIELKELAELYEKPMDWFLR